MRDLIKKILKEESEDYSHIKSGDMYEIPSLGVLVMVDKIVCDSIKTGQQRQYVDERGWGWIEWYADGCALIYRKSHDKGKTWDKWNHRIQRGWANVMIKKGHWVVPIDNETEFFD